MDPQINVSHEWQKELGASEQLAEALATWDGKRRTADLHQYSEWLRTTFTKDRLSWREYLVPPMTKMYIQRAELGDDTAIDEYAKWVTDVTPSQAGWFIDKLFEPMWRFHDRPAMIAAAEKMFNGAGSAWNPATAAVGSGIPFHDTQAAITSPLLGMAPFRRRILRELKNKKKAGIVTVGDRGSSTIVVGDGWKSGEFGDPGDPLLPKPGKTSNFRICDLLAAELSGIDGFPQIELYWPEDRRDAAVKQVAITLTRYGEHLNWSPLQQRLQEFSTPVMTFARLDHVATAKDVADGRAIFALDGERRKWPMPETPIHARWKNLHTRATIASTIYPASKEATNVIAWLDEGWVWQAEEVREGDKWVRWFGFVGPGYIGKAPADELELWYDRSGSCALRREPNGGLKSLVRKNQMARRITVSRCSGLRKVNHCRWSCTCGTCLAPINLSQAIGIDRRTRHFPQVCKSKSSERPSI